MQAVLCRMQTDEGGLSVLQRKNWYMFTVTYQSLRVLAKIVRYIIGGGGTGKLNKFWKVSCSHALSEHSAKSWFLGSPWGR